MTATDRAAYQLAYQGARRRALSRLMKRHRGEYAALLAEERQGPATGRTSNQNGNQ